MQHTRTRTFGMVLGAILIGSAAVSPGFAQSDAEYAAIVTGDKLDVRSGAGDTYYPFTQLKRGDIVTVIGERFGWARLRTEGPAFAGQQAYIRAREIRLSEDGRTGTALGRVQVIAPNMQRNGDVDSSWKWVTRLEPEQTVRVLGKVSGSEDYYEVAMPKTGEGWVSINFIRRATDEEVAEWKAKHARSAPPAQPTVPPAGETTQRTEPAPPPETLVDRDQPNPPIQTIDETEEGATVTHDPPAAIEDDANEGTETAPVEDITQEPETTEKTLAEVTLEDLEGAYVALKRVPVRGAEIEPLRDRYQALIEEHKLDERQQVIAEARITLLDTRLKLQRQMIDLEQIKARTELHEENTQQARIAIENAESYTAVGIVTASTIYDGQRLPRMLRLVDPQTSRTLVYIQPDGRFALVDKIGQLVGIVGDKAYDGGMRLSVITPKRVDILTRSQ